MRYLFAALSPLHPPAAGPASPTAAPTVEDPMATAGLTVRDVGEVDTPLEYPDLAAAVRIQSSSGPARLAIEYSGDEATREAIATAFAAVRRPDGTYRMDNVFRYLVATVD